MSDSGQNIATNSIFHYIQLILLIVLVVIALVGGYVFYINQNVPIPEQLVEDILVAQAKTCLAPIHPTLLTPIPGQIDEEKLTSEHMNNCITQNQEDFGGVRITHRETDSTTEYLFPGARVQSTSEKIPLLLKTSTDLEPIFFEVVFS